MKLIPNEHTKFWRDIYTKMGRDLVPEITVSEWIDQDNGFRFLACTCNSYQENGTYCGHIAHVYMNRLDVKSDEDNLGNPIETIIPEDWMATNVVILGNEMNLNILVWINEIQPVPGQVSGMMEVYLSMPDENGMDRRIELGILSRNAGRGEIRSAFLEWITAEMILNPLTCKQPWHEVLTDVPDSDLPKQIMNYCNILKNGMCLDCYTSDEIPEIHNTVTGVWDRDRSC